MKNNYLPCPNCDEIIDCVLDFDALLEDNVTCQSCQEKYKLSYDEWWDEETDELYSFWYFEKID